jgi:hypothetical protein
MGNRSWFIKVDQEKYELITKVTTGHNDFFIVGAARAFKSAKLRGEGTIFKAGDLILLCQSGGSYVVDEYPDIFDGEFCSMSNIQYVRTETRSIVLEFEYLTLEEFHRKTGW